MTHAPTQTVDRSDPCIQTDCTADPLGLEPGTNKECTLQTKLSSSVDVLGPQQVIPDASELESKHASSDEARGADKSVIGSGLEPRISSHNAALMHSSSLLPQHVIADPVGLEPKCPSSAEIPGTHPHYGLAIQPKDPRSGGALGNDKPDAGLF